jgi:heme-degrading monooxygenase HmoA
MHMRLVQIEVKDGEMSGLRDFYTRHTMRTLQQVKGCRYAGLMQSMHHPEQCISLTLWDSQDDARAYESGGTYQRLLEETRPYLSESSEYKIQLSEDLTLQYVPVHQEPLVKAYPIAARSEMGATGRGAADAMWLRIVSLKILPGKLDEFKRLYAEQSIPTLRKVKGCRYVYLLESDERSHEVLSVTSWDSRQDAEAYENSGLFEQLLEAQKQTLSGLYQWKRSLGKVEASHSATSEDIMVEHYTVLTGQNFK